MSSNADMRFLFFACAKPRITKSRILVAIGQQQCVLSRSEEELEKMASSHNAKRSKQAQEAVIIRKKATGKKESKASGGKTVVRRIKAK